MTTTAYRIRQFLFPVALTAACLVGAVGGGVWSLAPEPVSAQTPLRPAGCGNSECQGNVYCRYYNGVACRFQDRSTCVNTGC